VEQSESIKSLAAALCKARAAFPDIVKDREVEVFSKRTNSKYRFRYATLDNILGLIKGPLSDNGLSFIQSVDKDGVTLLLTHESGEWIRTDAMPIRCEENGAQAYGSAISYAKRYQICAVFGITADEDDDGNGADGNQQRQQTRTQPQQQNRNIGGGKVLATKPTSLATDAQVRQVLDLLNVVRLPEGTIDKWFAKAGVDIWEDMPATDIAGAIDYLKKRLPANLRQPAETVNTTTGEVTTNGDYADNPAFRKAVIEAFKARGFSETNLAIPAMLAQSKQGPPKKSLEDIPLGARALVVQRIKLGQFDKLKNLKPKKQAAA
jgi:hypothetical protein